MADVLSRVWDLVMSQIVNIPVENELARLYVVLNLFLNLALWLLGYQSDSTGGGIGSFF